MAMNPQQILLGQDPNMEFLEPMYPQGPGEESSRIVSSPVVDNGMDWDGNSTNDAPQATTDDSEIASMVTGRKKIAEEHQRSKKDVWDKCWDHMMQVYDDTGKESWQSKRFWPETPKVVETILANIHSAILTPKVPMEWGVKIKEFEDAVKDINDIIKNDADQSNMKLSLTDIFREMCILGTGVGGVDYKYTKKMMMVKQRQKPSLIQRATAKFLGQKVDNYGYDFTPMETITEDWANLRYVDRYKIFPEPYSTQIDARHWIIEETSITNAELVELANHEDEFYRLEGITDEILMGSGSKPLSKGDDDDLQVKHSDMNMNRVTMDYYDPDKPHNLLIYWGPAPLWMVKPELKGDEASKYESVNAWFWVLDGKYVVRKRPNCYRDGTPPYVKFTYLQMPGDWDGIGPAQLMMFLQIEKNELVNTALDNINIMLNKIMGIMKDKVPKDTWDRLVSKPGALWLFEQCDDIRKVVMPIEFNNLLKDIFIAINLVDQAIQETTGAVKATIGAGGADDEAGGGTFRGQAMNKMAASERFMLYARTLEAGGLPELWRKYYAMIYQYKSYENVEKILGPVRYENFEFLSPEVLDEVATLNPVGISAMETKAVKIAQIADFEKLWAGRPWLKEYELARKMWTGMDQSDADGVIFSKEEMDQFNQVKRQLIGQGQPGMPEQGMNGGNPGMPPMSPAMERNPAISPEVALNRGPQGPGVNPMDMGGPMR